MSRFNINQKRISDLRNYDLDKAANANLRIIRELPAANIYMQGKTIRMVLPKRALAALGLSLSDENPVSAMLIETDAGILVTTPSLIISNSSLLEVIARRNSEK